MKYIKRYIEKSVLSDLDRKMVFVGGPRQTGKTTLAKNIIHNKEKDFKDRYLNWDSAHDRELIMEEKFPAPSGYLILDEIHKFSNWRQVVKGLYDKRGNELKILVTGSAKLDYYRRGGDSLQGRYHFYRLLPLTMKELNKPQVSTVNDLLHFSGFPEPFNLASEKESRRWSREYKSRIIRDDLRDLETVSDISKLEQVVLRLPDLVGSPLSINSLREDIQVSHQTVSRWLNILENLYMIFRIYPFGAPSIRTVKKEAKHYFFDWTLIDDMGARFENLVAVHLLKWCYFMQDSEGRDVRLRYFRDVDKREVDFIITENNKPYCFIESKLKSKIVNPSLKYLKLRFPEIKTMQIVLEDDIDYITKEDIHICSAHTYLSDLI